MGKLGYRGVETVDKIIAGTDRDGNLALLRDLEAAAGQRVQQRWFAVVG